MTKCTLNLRQVPSAIISRLPGGYSRAPISYTPMLDETVVTLHLVLLIRELINLKRSSGLQCTVTRVRYVPQFGTQSYTAIVDGVVWTIRTDQVESILEAKPVFRFVRPALAQMQETAEAVGWLKHQSGGVPELRGKR